jgi:uncharacterized membrane protein YuzA (DUF378 family)
LGSSRTLNLDKFCHNHCSACSCVLAIPGALNILVTSTIGMKGDLMGFIVTPILIVVVIMYIVTWFVGVNAALEYQQVALEEDDNNNWCDDVTDNGGIACTSLA